MVKGNRQAKRRDIHVPFVYWGPENEERSGEGRDAGTRDISASGISFSLKKAYEIGTRLFIDIYLPGVNHPIKADIKIVRIEKLSHKDGFLYGCQFLDLPTQHKLLIDTSVNKNNLQVLLQSIIDGGGTDLHLTVGRPPMVRRKRKIMPMAADIIKDGQIEAMLYPLLSQERIDYFEDHKDLDFSFSPDLQTRFRVNMHWQKGKMEATLRVVPSEIGSFKELGLPEKFMKSLCDQTSGLVLFSGSVGAGKTTSMASMVDYINATQQKVILTLEDPIEYVFNSKRSIIKQREIGADTMSYSDALEHSLRQDPDVVCVGEIKDLTCLTAAMRAAETGYFVIATVHGVSAAGTVERLIGMVSDDKKDFFSQSLANCLRSVIYQKLLPCNTGGMVLATEVLVNEGPIYNLIKTNKINLIPDRILSGRATGMYTLDLSIRHLYEKGLIDENVFRKHVKEYT